MHRRAFLASLPTIALAGCLRWLGLTERVIVLEKSIEATEIDLDSGEERTFTLLRRRDGNGGPEYLDVHEDLEGMFEDDQPLLFEDEFRQELENEYYEVRLRTQICDTAPVGDPENASGCRSVAIVSEDFNEVRVGDAIDVRESNDGIGLLEVHRRREDR
ncbi:hypothetical protein ACLI4Y_12205 [Natrialbaceae archaeon A-CW3]